MIRWLQLRSHIGGSSEDLPITWPARSTLTLVLPYSPQPAPWAHPLCIWLGAVAGLGGWIDWIYMYFHYDFERQTIYSKRMGAPIVMHKGWRPVMNKREYNFLQDLKLRMEAASWWKEWVRVKWASVESEIHREHFTVLCILVLPVYTRAHAWFPRLSPHSKSNVWGRVCAHMCARACVHACTLHLNALVLTLCKTKDFRNKRL